MSPCLCANFTLIKDGIPFYEGYSEHCYFEVLSQEQKNRLGLCDMEWFGGSDFFSFSLESVVPEKWGKVIGLLTENIPCIIQFNGWWDIYVPIQYVESIKLV